MKTHLINNLDKFGVWRDNYHQFFEERAKVVSKEIGRRVIKQTIDESPQADIVDDLAEEAELE